MKNFLILLTILLGVGSCTFTKKPKFKYVDKVEVKNIGLKNVTLKADAVFDNPNDLKGKLSTDSIQVFIDNIHVGAIRAKEFKVPSKSEFAIPLEGTFSLSKIYNNNKNSILGSVLKAIQTDSITIQYKGVIRYHLGSFSYPYKIDKQQKISLR